MTSSSAVRAVRVYGLGDAYGTRWLVDRRWPRGTSREALQLSGWAREAAPSDELRRWFGHDPARWEEFRRRYLLELEGRPEAWQPLWEAARRGSLLLLYAARDEERNNAVVLRDLLLARLAGEPEDLGGDSVCWLDRVCPSCGRFAEDRTTRACPACGEPLSP